MNPRRDATNALPGGGTYVDAWNGVGYDGDAGHWSYGWTNSASLFRYDLVPGTTGADASDYQTAWQNDDHSYSASEYYGGGVDSNEDGGTDGGVGLAGDWSFAPWMVWPQYGGHFAGLASWQYWQWQHDVEHSGVNAGGDYTANGSLTLTPTLQTQLHLRTGGKQVAGRQDLFCLNATGQKYVSSAVGYYANIDVYPLSWSAQDLAAGEIQVMGKALGADHNLWLALPPGADVPLPVQVAADQCTVKVLPTKYHCWFTAYAEEPNPGGGRDSTIDWWHLTAGHGWWCLNSDAPETGLNKAGISIASLSFLNHQVGYFPAIASYFASTVPVVGELRDPGNGSRIDGQFTWEVGFNRLEGGLDFTANLSSNPGLYSLWAWPHTCVTTTIQAGAAAGVTLPNDETPQNLGIDLDALWVLP